MEEYKLSHLKELEAESIHIIREVAAEFENPVMLYSIGKDSSVMVRLAEKAFYPGKVPFPLMHIDSKWKFKEMIQFRDEYAKKYGWNLIVESNMEAFHAGVGPFTHGSKVHTDLMKTQALLHALDKYKFEIINLYIDQKLSCSKIADKLGCSLCGIYDALKRWKVSTRNLRDSHLVYSVNDDYFSEIDTEEKAYWLGFIYADGYVTGSKLGIAIANLDRMHLEKFKKCIGSDYKIKSYVSNSVYGSCKYCRILINSEKLVKDIMMRKITII